MASVKWILASRLCKRLLFILLHEVMLWKLGRHANIFTIQYNWTYSGSLAKICRSHYLIERITYKRLRRKLSDSRV
ncbi:hypothetical protein V1511DRAFT_505721 [Dipodascopsis uninucleata]